MHPALAELLTTDPSPAADEALLEALIRTGGDDAAAGRAGLVKLIARRAEAGHPGALAGAIKKYDNPSKDRPTRDLLLAEAGAVAGVVRVGAKSSDQGLRLASVRYAAASGRADLAPAAALNVGSASDALARVAADALVSLARRVFDLEDECRATGCPDAHAKLLAERKHLEEAFVDAMEHRAATSHPPFMAAALRLAGRADSRVLAVLSSPRHKGQATFIKRAQEPPTGDGGGGGGGGADGSAAMLLAAARHGLSGHLGVSVGRIVDPAAAATLARQSFRLADARVAGPVGRARRGVFREAAGLQNLLSAHPDVAPDAARWVAATSAEEQDPELPAATGPEPDTLLAVILDVAGHEERTRRAVLAACRSLPAGRGAATLKRLLGGDDERAARGAAREIARRRREAGFGDWHGLLLRRIKSAPPSLRQTIGRLIGESGFSQYWGRFDTLDPETRRQAGAALMKLLPDAKSHLMRRLASSRGRLRALQIADELGLADDVRPRLGFLLRDPQARVRSKAATLLGRGRGPGVAGPLMMALDDRDGRVRANAIDALRERLAEGELERELKDARPRLARLLGDRAGSDMQRERGNAVVALHHLDHEHAVRRLRGMLADVRPEHRVSGLWAVGEARALRLLPAVAQLAKADPHEGVRSASVRLLRKAAADAKAGPVKAEPVKVAA